MSTIYLKDYLKKISNLYSESKNEYFLATTKLSQLRESWNKEKARGWSQSNEREKATKNFYDSESKLKADIARIKNDTKKQIDAIREEVDRIFVNHYRPHASQVDLQAVELLKSGCLSDRELTLLVDDYKENFAMLKIIQPYIKKSAENNPKMRMLNSEIVLRTRPFTAHTEAIDSLCAWGDRQLQENIVVAENMAKHFESQAPQIIEQYGEYSAEKND